jgi:acetyl-CoA C-acetyltransferase
VEYAARMAYDMAGISEPRKQIHIVEPYDPFDYKSSSPGRSFVG